MDVERARAYLHSLPHVVETMQWGANLVFWVGDKAIGGKMFALIDLDGDLAKGVAIFPVGPERFHSVLENEELIPAPYFARIHWVAAKSWSALRNSEWEEELRSAHAMVQAKLPKKVLTHLALPATAQKKALAEAKAKAAAAPVKAKRRSAAKKRET